MKTLPNVIRPLFIADSPRIRTVSQVKTAQRREARKAMGCTGIPAQWLFRQALSLSLEEKRRIP